MGNHIPLFLGKEIMVFYERISYQLNKLKSLTYTTNLEEQ